MITDIQITGKLTEIYTGGFPSVYHTGHILSPCTTKLNFLNLESGAVDAFISSFDGSSILSTACAPDGKVAVALQSSLIYVYKPIDKEMLKWEVFSSWKCAGVNFMDWDSTSTLISVACADSTVKVFDAKGSFCTHNFRAHRGVVHYCKFYRSKDNYILFSCGIDCTIRVWDLVSSKLVATLDNHMAPVTALRLINKWKLVSVGRDKIISFWDLRTNELISTLPVYAEIEALEIVTGNSINNLEVDTGYVGIIGESSGNISFWDLDRQELLHRQENTEAGQSVEYLIITPNNECIIFTEDHNIIIYNIDLPLSHVKTLVGFNDEIFDIHYLHKEENDYVVLASNSEQIRAFQIGKNEYHFFTGHTDLVLALALSHDHRYIASVSKDNTVKIWDTDTLNDGIYHTPVCSGEGHADSVTSVCWFNNSNELFLTASADLTLKLWSFKNGEVRVHSTVKAHSKEINSISISPNNELIATGSQDKSIKLWKVHEGQNSASLVPFRELKGHKRGVWSVKFSPIDKLLASSSTDQTVKLWSLNDFSCQRTFEGHNGSVLRIGFINKGMQLVSTASDGLIKFWNINNSECINTFEAHEDKIWGFSVRDDEQEFISAGGDSTIVFWKNISEDLRKAKQKENEELVLLQQELNNVLRAKDYVKSIKISLKLGYPHKTYQIFDQVIQEENCDEILDEIVRSLEKEEMEQVFGYVNDWNTTGKYSLVSQSVLYHFFTNYHPNTLLEMDRIKTLLQSLIPYTERHFKRFEKLSRQSYLIDYTLSEMNVLEETKEPEVDIFELVEQKSNPLKRKTDSDSPKKPKKKKY